MSVRGFQNIVTDGLVFGVDSFNNLNDNTAQARDIINQSVTGSFVNGLSVVNGVYAFDGVDDHLDFGRPNFGIGTGAFTIDAWIKHGAANDQYPICLAGHRHGVRIRLSNNFRGISVYKGWLDSAGFSPIDRPSETSDNKWHHYSITSVGQVGEIYIDGASIPVNMNNGSFYAARTFRDTSDTLEDMYFGQWAYKSFFGFTGEIANVKFYNRVLTASEVLQNHNALKHRFQI